MAIQAGGSSQPSSNNVSILLVKSEVFPGPLWALLVTCTNPNHCQWVENPVVSMKMRSRSNVQEWGV